MRVRSTCSVCVTVGLLLAVGSEAGASEAERPASWIDSARKQGLSTGDVKRLERQKILVTNEAFKQIFTPYVEPVLPFFVTSDSLLNAFHVLYEESVFRLESTNSGKLAGILETIRNGLEETRPWFEGRPDVTARARRRARILIGTALALLGEPPVGGGAKVEAAIAEEVARIVEAKAVLKPAWLGPPDGGFEALDYSRYRPRGFYTRRPELERYFRAVSWLQSVPHRVSVDEELLAAVMLYSCSRF